MEMSHNILIGCNDVLDTNGKSIIRERCSSADMERAIAAYDARIDRMLSYAVISMIMTIVFAVGFVAAILLYKSDIAVAAICISALAAGVIGLLMMDEKSKLELNRPAFIREVAK